MLCRVISSTSMIRSEETELCCKCVTGPQFSMNGAGNVWSSCQRLLYCRKRRGSVRRRGPVSRHYIWLYVANNTGLHYALINPACHFVDVTVLMIYMTCSS